MKLRDYFDRTLVINLPSRTDRRKDMSRELTRQGMLPKPGQIEFFEAIRPDSADGFPTIGLHGCFLSHLNIARLARVQGLSRVLVLEDDCQPSKKLAACEDSIVEQLRSQHWDFVYFGHELALGSVAPDAHPLLVPYVGDIGLTHFYGMNAPVLDRWIAFMEALILRPPGHPDGGPMSPDGAISFFRSRNPDLVTLVCKPSLGWQRSSRTDAHPLSWADRTPIIRDLMYVGRRAKNKIQAKY